MPKEKTTPTTKVNCVVIHPASEKWGRFPMFFAKVGTGPSDLVIVRKVRKFFVGQRINFVRSDDVKGMKKGSSPDWWRVGIVWKIEDNRLFISLN